MELIQFTFTFSGCTHQLGSTQLSLSLLLLLCAVGKRLKKNLKVLPMMENPWWQLHTLRKWFCPGASQDHHPETILVLCRVNIWFNGAANLKCQMSFPPPPSSPRLPRCSEFSFPLECSEIQIWNVREHREGNVEQSGNSRISTPLSQKN